MAYDSNIIEHGKCVLLKIYVKIFQILMTGLEKKFLLRNQYFFIQVRIECYFIPLDICGEWITLLGSRQARNVHWTHKEH